MIQSVLYGYCLIGHTKNISSKFAPFGQLDSVVQVQVQDQTTSQTSNTNSDPPIQSYQFQAPPDNIYDDDVMMIHQRVLLKTTVNGLDKCSILTLMVTSK